MQYQLMHYIAAWEWIQVKRQIENDILVERFLVSRFVAGGGTLCWTR